VSDINIVRKSSQLIESYRYIKWSEQSLSNYIVTDTDTLNCLNTIIKQTFSHRILLIA